MTASTTMSQIADAQAFVQQHRDCTDQLDVVLCEDDQTIFVYLHIGDDALIASVTLPSPIDPADFDREQWHALFLAGLTVH